MRVSQAVFPISPGVYVVRDGGAQPLYVGVAATQTIERRWRGQHLRPRSGGSALRRTLGVELGLVGQKLTAAQGRYYPDHVEQAITEFLLSCTIEFHPTRDPESARVLERDLIARLNPRLNVVRSHVTSVERQAKKALTEGLQRLRADVALDERGYVTDVRNNLLPTITLEEIEGEFAAGAGGELRSKMLAPWSSSALVVNSFAPWRGQLDSFRIADTTGFSHLSFERKCNHGVRGESPHLDVLLEGEKEILGIESKCLEYTRPHSRAVVADAYRALARRGDARAASRWFAALDHVHEFAHLDGYQLVKHYLGLVYSFPDSTRTLIYLYWEPESVDPLFQAHRTELARFADMVRGDTTCTFASLSYREHWAELRSTDGVPWLAEHLSALRKRYTVAL